ncbi:hypothetical protein [Streptacidiphilus neutrinimicus]|uniref:hypothetical protein n=1 Tax=Streptacidiphilus neutrinimicus TaxID=105420 RepID=UPI0005A8FA69|nr:hypothetical protein [Streptacidiphilus neutrinimicus]
MVRYLLRAEDLHADDAVIPCGQRWHVARVGAVFALCTRRLPPATSVRPIQEADNVRAAERCPECWARAFNDLKLPA